MFVLCRIYHSVWRVKKKTPALLRCRGVFDQLETRRRDVVVHDVRREGANTVLTSGAEHDTVAHVHDAQEGDGGTGVLVDDLSADETYGLSLEVHSSFVRRFSRTAILTENEQGDRFSGSDRFRNVTDVEELEDTG